MYHKDNIRKWWNKVNFVSEITKIKNGPIAQVYVVLGTESYLASVARKTLTDSLLTAEELELNFGAYDMEEVTIGTALEDAESIPFFGDRRVVFVDRPIFLTGEKIKSKLEHDLKWLESYLSHPSESTTLVFFAPYEKLDERKKITKLLKKTATVIEVNALVEKDMRKYVKDTIENEGYRYSPEAFELFIQLTDARLSVAMGELPKLFLYAQDTKYITKEAVQELVAKSLEQNIFALNEYVLKKDVGQALNLYQDLLLQKEDPIKINAIMTSQFRLLIQVKILEKKGYQQGDIAKQIKTHPYRVKLAIQQMRKIKEASLIEAYNGLIDAEYRLKTGQGDKEMQFELFVLQYAQKNSLKKTGTRI